jgi:tetratricopeptide (TPR) repeat protein
MAGQLDTVKLDKALRLAKKKSKEGQSEEAKKIYQDILKKYPKHKKALLAFQSLTEDETSVPLDPSPQALQSILNLYTQGHLQLALSGAIRMLETFPNSIVLYNIVGVSNAGLMRFEAAIEAYKQALKIKPDYSEVYNNMGVAQNAKGDPEAAMACFKQAALINPDYAEAYNNIGLAFSVKGQTKAAITSYEKAVLIKPDYADAYNNMANALQEKGDLKGAIESYNKVVLIQPHYAEAYYNMGIAYKGIDNTEAAIGSYKQAIKINPHYVEAFINIGIVLKDSGHHEAAINSYKQALNIKPDYADALFNMGVSLQDLGDLQGAISSYNKAVSIKPDYAEAYNNMGIALQGKSDLDAAVKSFEMALQTNPDYAQAYNNLGIALKDKGDLDAALRSYEKALRVEPEYADAYFNMGTVLQDKGDLNAAIESCIKALKIKPDYAQVWSNLVFLLQAIKLQDHDVEELLLTVARQATSQHTQILKSILRYSLCLGSDSAKSAFNETCSLLSAVGNKIIKNPQAINQQWPHQVIEPNKVVSLVHFGRSGTGLLHSLIDAHPEVSALPSIYFSEFFNHATWEKIVVDGWDGMIDRFIAIYEVLFDASARSPIETTSQKYINYLGQKDGMAHLGDQRNEVLRVNKALFREELERLMKVHNHLDALAFFRLIHVAYNKSVNDHNHKSLIFYHIHNPDTYAKLNFAQSAPHVNWVIMVREPIQACESWVRSSVHDNKYIGVVSKIVTMLYELDNVVYQQQNAIGLRLEDLKKSPKKTIPALCDWLGIKETESLYEMTAQGKKWWGDPGSPDFKKDGMEPFGKTSIERTLGSIFTENDQFILRTLFYPFSVRFGYAEQNLEQFKVDLQAIRPMLDKMFDFEKKMAQRMHKNAQQFMKSGYYLYLRSGLIDRWNMLAKWHTYPNMIKPLKINQ